MRILYAFVVFTLGVCVGILMNNHSQREIHDALLVQGRAIRGVQDYIITRHNAEEVMGKWRIEPSGPPGYHDWHVGTVR